MGKGEKEMEGKRGKGRVGVFVYIQKTPPPKFLTDK